MPNLLTSTDYRTAINKLTGAAEVAIGSSTNASPTVVTITGHGLVTGDVIAIYGHATNTALNGARVVTKLSADTFKCTDLNTGSAVNGNGVGGNTGKIMRITSGLTPHDILNLQDALDRLTFTKGTDADSSNESTLQSIFSL